MKIIGLGVLLFLLTFIVASDIRTRRIPNVLILTGLGLGFGFSLAADGIGIMQALGGFAIGFGVLFPLYLLRVLGAGDVKLVAMTGTFMGVNATLGTMLAAMLAGGVLAIGCGVYMGRLRETLRSVRFMLYHALLRVAEGGVPKMDELPTTGIKLPYSVAIASGVVIFLSARYWITGTVV
ncbi:MAG: prepilin peptidase [Burkholderiales bacterium]|nr:prepilin peptidase [Burkholderiales bacterium]